MITLIYSTLATVNGRVSHLNEWRCDDFCETCNKRFFCWSRSYLTNTEIKFLKVDKSQHLHYRRAIKIEDFNSKPPCEDI